VPGGRVPTRPLAEPLAADASVAYSGKEKGPVSRAFLKADDGARTRDPWLGKPMLYQLSYVRALDSVSGSRR
jgi:hypothetical protein